MHNCVLVAGCVYFSERIQERSYGSDSTTTDAKGLWARIKKAIEDEEIKTWEFHDDKVYFTHKAPQWNKKAWFKATVGTGVLTFNIVKPKSSEISTEIYAEFHGLLIRMLLADFNKSFSSAQASALAASGDTLK